MTERLRVAGLTGGRGAGGRRRLPPVASPPLRWRIVGSVWPAGVTPVRRCSFDTLKGSGEAFDNDAYAFMYLFLHLTHPYPSTHQ